MITHKKGSFWIRNDFIRKYAKNLTIHAQMIYIVLACHCDKNHITFIGYRKIGELIKADKNTVLKKIKELEAYGHIIRLDKHNGRASHIKVNTVPFEHTSPYDQRIHKEYILRNYNKEEEKNINENTPYRGRELMRDQLEKMDSSLLNNIK